MMRAVIQNCRMLPRLARERRMYGIESIERSLGRQAASHLIKTFNVEHATINSPTTLVSEPGSLKTWDWVAGIDSSPKYSREHLTGLSTKSDPFHLVQNDMKTLSQAMKELLGSDHPVLESCAKYFFDTDGGKKIRPAMVLAMSYALNFQPSSSTFVKADDDAVTSIKRDFASPSQHRLAEITEMIHTASLFHDDVIDKASTRRGVPSVNQVFGNKLAILGGDFLLSRASIALARLRNIEVVEIMSTVIEHLVKGEIMQMRPTTTKDVSALEYYLRKNFYKTASLMGHSCLSAAVLVGCDEETRKACYLYGTYVGQAFQLIDDALDFEGSTAMLGKAPLADLKSGLATAPTLFAADEHPRLLTLIGRKFESPGDIDEALDLVVRSKGLQRCRELAQVHAEMAIDAISILQDSKAKDALIALACKVIVRNN